MKFALLLVVAIALGAIGTAAKDFDVSDMAKQQVAVSTEDAGGDG